ncbi:MAG: hypothetical protein ACLSAH_03750 [Bilophila wadsworthia]
MRYAEIVAGENPFDRSSTSGTVHILRKRGIGGGVGIEDSL